MSRIVYPCGPCKIQRKKCGDKCILAPYFPPNDPHKFFVVRKIFGASNIAKILEDIPGEKRGDAVRSLVYEASARLNDPIYGCTAEISRLQNQVLHLQSQLATVQAELLNAHGNLVVSQNNENEDIGFQYDDDPFGLWAPL
ncbi:LOB domain-containing protein 12-like [Cryptomeria japonica]|uniref:LOB domain-containing protein 12-like n=1 Tax=Cryptomeria japonica TaxID=3369 RepID=UPI0027DA3609|nr:LOB domain-containing protein 12-like [Cryptomeria japonica]XP_059073949.1 LOB domain-containing protein 12-like [Cryptomeria japonica]